MKRLFLAKVKKFTTLDLRHNIPNCRRINCPTNQSAADLTATLMDSVVFVSDKGMNAKMMVLYSNH